MINIENTKCDYIIHGTDQKCDYIKFEQHTNTSFYTTAPMLPMITKPTGLTPNSATPIDNIYITHKLSDNVDAHIITYDMSYHLPILVRIEIPLKAIQTIHRPIMSRTLTKAPQRSSMKKHKLCK